MSGGTLGGTLTIRLSAAALRKLRARAKRQGVTPSELVRAALENDLGESVADEPTALDLTERWVGSVSSDAVPSGRAARDALSGWAPDRRG